MLFKLLVSIQLVRLSHAVSYARPLWGAMPAAPLRKIAWKERVPVQYCKMVRFKGEDIQDMFLKALLTFLPACDVTATISVCPCPPVRDFELVGRTRLVRGEALALFKSGHVGMRSIENRIVANTAMCLANFWEDKGRWSTRVGAA
eukprot:1161166-Pelagomonas_calceolata.AAC.1